jgi:hypothetical protein
MTDDMYVKSGASVGEAINASFATSITLQDEEGIVVEGQNWVELVANIRAVLAEARAQGAADERERLAPHLHTAIAVITEMLEREGISDP